MKKIGKYEIQGKLGSGGMGIVYKAVDPLMERTVAIKTMSEDLDSEPHLRERFFREARSAGQLSHKNIVTIYDLGVEGHMAYIAMEYLDGEDLKSKIDRGEKISLETGLGLVCEVCEGLAHAHHRGVIHRDVKPGNIHITQNGHVKIMDFGLAKIASSNITKTGIAMGTPNYMSPEQAKGEKIDQRSDIFSVGAVFYELLTHRKPFDPYSNYDWRQVFFKVIFEEPEPLSKFNPAIPAELAAIVERAMAKEPQDRYAQIDDMSRDLEKFQKLLEEKKREIQEEARRALGELDRLIEANRALLQTELAVMGTAEDTAIRPSFTHGFLELVEIRERARSEILRLNGILEERKKLSGEWERAAALESEGKLDDALALGEKVLAAIPDHAETTRLVARVRDEVEKRRKIEDSLQKAKALSEREDFEACLVVVEDLLRIAPQHPEASRLRDEAHARIETKRKARQAEALLQEAASSFSEDDLTSALTRLDEVLKLRPGHTAAAALQERARERLKARALAEENRGRAEAFLSDARRAFSARDLGRAVEGLKRARALAPELPGLSDLAQEIEREEKLRGLVDEAQSLGRSGRENDALSKLEEVFQIAADYAPATELKGQIASRREKRERAEKERKARVLAAVSEAKEYLRLEKLDDAVARARAALVEEPSHREAQEILDSALKAQKEREERKKIIAEKLSKARKLEKEGDFTETLVLIRSVLTLEDSHPEALELAKRAEEARRLTREAKLAEGKKALSRGEWTVAEKAARDVQASEAENAEASEILSRARKGIEEDEARRRKITEGLRKAREMEQGGDFEQTLLLVRTVLKLDDSHPEALELEKRVNEAKEQARVESEGRKLIARADAEKDPKTALALLETAEPALRGLDSVKRAAEGFQKAVRDRETAQEIQAGLDQAKEALKTNDFRLCEAAAARVLSLAPDHAEARNLLTKAKEALATAHEIESSLRSAEQASKAERWESALSRVERALALDPRHERALRLKREAEREIEQKRERDKKRERARKLLADAESALKSGDRSGARNLLDEAEGVAPDLAGAGKLRRRIEKTESGKGSSSRLLLYAAAGIVAAGVVALTVSRLLPREPREEDTLSLTTTAVRFATSVEAVPATTSVVAAVPTTPRPEAPTSTRPQTTTIVPATTISTTSVPSSSSTTSTTSTTTTAAPTTSVAPRTTSVAAEASPRAESDGVRAAVERYRVAMQEKSLPGLRAVYPGLDRRNERQLRGVLDATETVRVELTCGEPRISGTTATLECARVDDWVFRDGHKETSKSAATFSLAKRDGSWIIERLSGK